MSMMVSFVLSFFPRDVLDEILNLIESVSEDFPSYSYIVTLYACANKYTRLVATCCKLTVHCNDALFHGYKYIGLCSILW